MSSRGIRAPSLAGCLLLASCASAEEPAKPTPAQQPTQSVAKAAPNPDAPAVIFETSDGKKHRVTVEIARTPQEVSRGLMYRRHLAKDHGMVFIFPFETQQSFWMKNTLIPLDMIFVRSSMKVLGVVHEAEPRSLTSRRVPGPSQFVVEVNGGWAKEHGVEAGTAVRFENFSVQPADGP